MSVAYEPIVGRYVHVEVAGRDNRVYVEEAGTGIPLVCLHTAGADGRQFRHLMLDDAITCNYRVVAFDMPWHGKSNPPAGWQDEEYQLTTALYVETVMAVCRALELDGLVVMGCSIGGRIVLQLALEHGDEFRAAIGLQSAAYQEPWYDTVWLHRPDVHGGEVCAALISGLIAPQSPDETRFETLWQYMQGGPGVFKGGPPLLPGRQRLPQPYRSHRHGALSALYADRRIRLLLPTRGQRGDGSRDSRGQPADHGRARSFSHEREPRAVPPLHPAGARRNPAPRLIAGGGSS